VPSDTIWYDDGLPLPGSHLYQSSPKDGAAPGFPLSIPRSISYGFGSKNPVPGVAPLFSESNDFYFKSYIKEKYILMP
jgi:hypothetical protein